MQYTNPLIIVLFAAPEISLENWIQFLFFSWYSNLIKRSGEISEFNDGFIHLTAILLDDGGCALSNSGTGGIGGGP